jgi:hypothetical protein
MYTCTYALICIHPSICPSAHSRFSVRPAAAFCGGFVGVRVRVLRVQWRWAALAARRGMAVCIARPAWADGDACALAFGIGRVARVGRRRDLDTRDRERAVGWPIWAQGWGRRRRRHLRPRRLGRPHRTQRPVGEHRRRCGLAGCLWGTRGYSGIVTGYPGGQRGV